MKYALVKKETNFRLFDRNISYNELPKDESIFDLITDLPLLGYVLGLKADFLIFEPSLDFDDYDVLIFLDPIYLEKHSEQIWCYFPVEPSYRNRNIFKTFDVMLDPYILHSRDKRIIPFYFRYPVDLMRLHLSKKEDKIFLQKRTRLQRKPNNFEVENYPNRTYREYFRVLSSCSFLFNLDLSPSPGQIIAESAIFDVISLARPSKLFQKLCYPQICWVSNEKELWERYYFLKNSESLREKILDYVRSRVYLLDFHNLEKYLENKLRDLSC